MKRFALVLLAVATTATLATESKAQLGVAAGLNFESVSDISTSSVNTTYENATGYHIGIFLDVGGGPVGLRLGAFYRELGEFDVSVNALQSTIDVSALDFPLDLKFSVLPTPVVRPYIMGGPVLSIPRSTDDDYDESLESISVQGNVGFGLEINLGGVKLMPEFRYAIGVTSFVKNEFTIAGQQFLVSSNDQRSNSVMLRLGIGL